uniref:Uncharacterized protein n=1 Tax=viral metagenome TaxID=1070528 RepID=A0A6C0DH98_9ZZZZ
MGKIRTSAISYWRGVPKDFHSFGALTQANYPIVQPQEIILRDLNNNQAKIRSMFTNYMNIQRLR